MHFGHSYQTDFLLVGSCVDEEAAPEVTALVEAKNQLGEVGGELLLSGDVVVAVRSTVFVLPVAAQLALTLDQPCFVLVNKLLR